MQHNIISFFSLVIVLAYSSYHRVSFFTTKLPPDSPKISLTIQMMQVFIFVQILCIWSQLPIRLYNNFLDDNFSIILL